VNLGRDWELLSQDIRRSFASLGFRDATRAEAKFFDLRGTASREARCGLWDGPHPQAPQPLKSVPSSPGAKTPGLARLKGRKGLAVLMRSPLGQKPMLASAGIDKNLTKRARTVPRAYLDKAALYLSYLFNT
jgi:hypothetical protein